ncbi:cyclic nucleotide-binding domain-containing protein [Clostridium sp. CX1]|uniref:Crp/Fnr family transcriptional regulator n=1 Tax=Clostridium sp. CX1 TaxID=2978346 RepID=UPI0021C24D8D|nr:cyclic nucleotide-binding domain-containing protein [Clostridium sp. CX1]MCT8976183.1 cyclic nucleotide-binding domain-containing protein [Clostridium sp. CX1]
MELKDICIYDHIKDYLDEISIVSYKKGQYITRSSENLEEIFFILDGKVKVECITKYGKSFLVDELSENEFVGKISYMHDQNLFCDIKATSNASLLKIDKNTFKKLQQSSDFMKIFLLKTSNRIYYMYKKLMMKDLFKFEELFAFHILKNSENNIFKFKSMYSLCKVLSVSRKGLYNTINRFIKENCIRKDENSIVILDRQYLNKISTHVREFNETNGSDLKFDI